MDPITAAIATFLVTSLQGLAGALVAALWKAYKSKIVLGAAIFVFSAGGLAMVIWSRTVTGWNQTALLGFGTSFLIVGTVELGVLGVLKNIIDPDHTSGLIDRLYQSLSQRFDALDNQLGIPAVQGAEFGELQKSPGEVQQ